MMMSLVLPAVLALSSQANPPDRQGFFPGVYLGQSAEEARAVFEMSSPTPYPLRRGGTISVPAGRMDYVMFCDGRVDVMARTVGTNAAVFAELVEAALALRGEPTTRASHDVGDHLGPWNISRVDLDWDDPENNRRYTLGFLESGGRIHVRETVSTVRNECPWVNGPS